MDGGLHTAARKKKEGQRDAMLGLCRNALQNASGVVMEFINLSICLFCLCGEFFAKSIGKKSYP